MSRPVLTEDQTRWGSLALVIVFGILGAFLDATIVCGIAITASILTLGVAYMQSNGRMERATADVWIHLLIGVVFASWAAWVFRRMLI